MKRLDFSLYVITGENYHPGRRLEDVMREALSGGADIVQLRDKTATPAELAEKARLLRRLTREFGVPFIVNDHPLLALETEADGVHLGQDDLHIAEARVLLGADRIIGISTHSLKQALSAERAGADYIGVGPVYPTGTKPGRAAVTLEYVRQAAKHVHIPWTAIGGIHLGNVDEVLAAGAARICAVSAIVGSSDPAAVCRELRGRIDAARGVLTAETIAGTAAENAVKPITKKVVKNIVGAVSKAGGVRGAALILLNGKETLLTAATLEELVRNSGLAGQRIVAEVNGDIIGRGSWGELELCDGMEIELVHFVGGG